MPFGFTVPGNAVPRNGRGAVPVWFAQANAHVPGFLVGLSQNCHIETGIEHGTNAKRGHGRTERRSRSRQNDQQQDAGVHRGMPHAGTQSTTCDWPANPQSRFAIEITAKIFGIYSRLGKEGCEIGAYDP